MIKELLTKEMLLADSYATTSDFEVPAPEGRDYYGFQRAAVAYAYDRWKAGAPGVLFADPMGLGKSIEAIGFINATRPKRVLIICPAFLKVNWERELDKWLCPPVYTVETVEGRKVWTENDITIINYEIVNDHKKAIHAKEWDLVICDESHRLKTPTAKSTRAILGAGKRRQIRPIPTKFLLMMSGTPILNRAEELWTTIRALYKGDDLFLKDYFKFTTRYCDAKPGWNGARDTSGSSNLGELNQKLRSLFMKRCIKKEAMPELPSRVRQIIPLPMTSTIKRQIDVEMQKVRLHNDTIEQIRERTQAAKTQEDEEGFANEANSVESQLLESFEDLSTLRRICGEATVPMAVQHIKDVMDDPEAKLIVFAHHHSVLEMLHMELSEYGCVMVHGQTPSRQAMIDKFQENSHIRIFIGGTHACGVGITLTAANQVIFVESDWVPAILSQAEDRAVRIGQTKQVLVQHLVPERSVIAKMVQVAVRKQDVLDRVLDEKADRLKRTVGSRKSLSFKKNDFSFEQKKTILGILNRIQAHRDTPTSKGGFNMLDANDGQYLASQDFLTNDEAGKAMSILSRHTGQVSEEEWEDINK